MRVIDADALHDMLQYLEDCFDKKAYEKIDFRAAYIAGIVDGVKQKVANFPTLDYAPVRHGEWVQGKWATYPEGYVCNRCSTGYAIPYNYCPRCGAKMDGGKKDENA